MKKLTPEEEQEILAAYERVRLGQETARDAEILIKFFVPSAILSLKHYGKPTDDPCWLTAFDDAVLKVFAAIRKGALEKRAREAEPG